MTHTHSKKIPTLCLNNTLAICAICIALSLILLIAWASFAPVSGASVAGGSIRTEGNRQKVQHHDGGIIAKLHIREGDYVEKGGTLITLDNEGFKEREHAKYIQYLALRLQRLRLEAFNSNNTRIILDPTTKKLATRLGKINDHIKQQQLLDHKNAVVNENTKILTSRIARLATEINGLNKKLISLRKQQQLLEQKTRSVQQLADKNYVAKHQITQLKREATDLDIEINTTKTQRDKNEEQIKEIALSRQLFLSRNRYETLRELTSIDERVPQLESELAHLQRLIDRTRITSPTHGRITNLISNTVGETIKAGALLMEIVPEQAKLIVEAQLNPQDIDNIQTGNIASVRLTGYSNRRTPPISARVIQISADHLTNRHGNTFYKINLELDSASLKNQPHIKLYPGMPAEAIIQNGKRTLFDYLLTPIIHGSEKSLREL